MLMSITVALNTVSAGIASMKNRTEENEDWVWHKQHLPVIIEITLY